MNNYRRIYTYEVISQEDYDKLLENNTHLIYDADKYLSKDNFRESPRKVTHRVEDGKTIRI